MQTDVTAIVREALGADIVLAAPPERIAGGLTNENWLVRAAGGAWVVRIGNPRSAQLQIDRRAEQVALRAAAHAGLGPLLTFCDPERQWLVTEYLGGAAWTARQVRQQENIVKIAAMLRKLHALPKPPGARHVDLHAILSGYWNELMATGLGARTGAAKQRARARHLAAELATDAVTCLCHNDLHHLNVVEREDGALRLVDWEYAGIGDPYFDLASVCCYHAFNDADRAALLRAYLGADRRAALERLHRMCWLFDYIRELWFAVRESP